MGTNPSYEEIAGVLAQYVHDFLYQEERFINRPAQKAFDHGLTSNLEILADVLTQLLIVALIALAREDGPKDAAPLDLLTKLGICEPVEFKTKVLDLSHGVKVTLPDIDCNCVDERAGPVRRAATSMEGRKYISSLCLKQMVCLTCPSGRCLAS